MGSTSNIAGYDTALAFLFGRINYERVQPDAYKPQFYKLARMRDLLRRLGNPHQAAPAIHLAGTKGKGSTATMIAACLTRAGYRTGLYTSPHLHCIEERMVVDGAICSQQEFAAAIATIRPVVEEMDQQTSAAGGSLAPTFFEITTALAMLHFKQSGCDAVVLETGLGGRLDSTNVVTPAVSIITSISYDHTHLLGDTLAKIAREKAGIIKPGVPVVSGVVEQEPAVVIAEVAHSRGSPLILRGRDFHFEHVAAEETSSPLPPPVAINFRMQTAKGEVNLPDVRTQVRGAAQGANAACALATVQTLRQQGWRIADDDVRQALAATTFAARIEVLQQSPVLIVDVAHNVASVRSLVEVIRGIRCQGRRTLVFATSSDKDPDGMLRELAPQFQRIIVTRFHNNPRASDPQALAGFARQHAAEDAVVEVAAGPQEATDLLRSSTGAEDAVCVAGSFFIAAEMRAILQASPLRVD